MNVKNYLNRDHRLDTTVLATDLKGSCSGHCFGQCVLKTLSKQKKQQKKNSKEHMLPIFKTPHNESLLNEARNH